MRSRALFALFVVRIAVALGVVSLCRPMRARADDAPPTEELVPIASPRRVEAPRSQPSLEPPPDLSDLVGRPITRLDIVLEGDGWRDPRPTIGSVRAGQPLTAAAARHALDELLASGRYARGQVAARADGSGAALELRVSPRRLIGRLRADVHGAAIDRDDLVRQAALADGDEIVATDMDDVRSRITDYLALHGYPEARAAITVRDTADPLRAVVLLDVWPGPARTIDRVRIEPIGADADRLLALARQYAISAPARADESKLDQADSALEQAARGHGWVRAGVSHRLALARAPGRPDAIVLRVRIDAGPLVMARFEGNEHYDADVLTAVLAVETDTDRSPTHLSDKLHAFYEKRGFLDVQVRVEMRPSPGGAREVVMFHIDEGRRVLVSDRSYPCLKLDAVKRLRAGGPRSAAGIGTEIDSYLDEELPGADFFVNPDPRAVDATVGGGSAPNSGRSLPPPIDLSPHATYVGETYERAVSHVQELYRNEGFLHAQVGPVGVVRARCDPRSRPGTCVPLPVPPLPDDVCAYDPSGLPAPTAPLPPALTCRPDPAHGVECAGVVEIVIPVKLGPRTRLWDIAFTGVHATSERALADAAQGVLGEAASTTRLEDARRRIVDAYRELGYYYADVKYALEPSEDNTRARVRFEVAEGEQVIVDSIVIRGLQSTSERVVRRRIALEVGRPYRPSAARTTQERVSTLGVFSSVTVSISEPAVPQANKEVVVDVVERDAQYVEVRPGFSTGEGVRGAIEYGHRNLLGDAWSMTVHLQASYLPDFLILDAGVAQNFGRLKTLQRIATRDTLTFAWPEVGLGPTIRAQLDGVFVNDLERDFTLRKAAVVGTLIARPVRQFQISTGADFESNYVALFNHESIAQYLMMEMQQQKQATPELATLLRVPDGESNAVAARVALTWDRRDSAFNAHRGTYLAAGIEEVNSYPVGNVIVAGDQQYQSHFFRLTQTIAGYLPLLPGVALAAELRVGEIVTPWCSERPGPGVPAHWSCTYPDRLFFMGGFDSMRGWLQDSFIPQDYVDQIRANPSLCVNNQTDCKEVPLRGGNLMINPRLELRFPIRLPVEGAIFGDLGNLWVDPSYLLTHTLVVRADVGAGVRVDTPVGPLVFDYGINVTRRPYEDFGAFHFAIGLF